MHFTKQTPALFLVTLASAATLPDTGSPLTQRDSALTPDARSPLAKRDAAFTCSYTLTVGGNPNEVQATINGTGVSDNFFGKHIAGLGGKPQIEKNVDNGGKVTSALTKCQATDEGYQDITRLENNNSFKLVLDTTAIEITTCVNQLLSQWQVGSVTCDNLTPTASPSAAAPPPATTTSAAAAGPSAT